LVQEYQKHQTGAASAKSADEQLLRATHKTIKKVGEDIQSLSFNTAIATQMEMVNELYKIKAEDDYTSEQWQFALTSLLQAMAPFAPHIAEELWSQLGRKNSIHTSPWPQYDDKYLTSDSMTVVVQVNGKVRAQLEQPVDAAEDDIVAAAKTDANVATYLENKSIVKVIYVAGKLVNFVVK